MKYDISFSTLDGKPSSLANYRDKAVLIVNVASKCGLTPQYAGLQALHDRYEKRGFRAKVNQSDPAFTSLLRVT